MGPDFLFGRSAFSWRLLGLFAISHVGIVFTFCISVSWNYLQALDKQLIIDETVFNYNLHLGMFYTAVKMDLSS